MANEYLKRIPTSTGNRKVFTWSGWIKRNKLGGGSDTALFASTSGEVFRIRFAGSDKIDFIYYNGTNYGYAGTQVLRDVGGWMHILMSVDSTDEIGDNRMMLFLNGVHYIGSKMGTQVPINTDFPTNSLITHWIGCDNGPTGYWNGELADVFFVDGQALTPDVFGFYKDGNGYISAGSTQSTDFRPGQWVPKTPRVIKAQIERNGGFGVNGFYLPMNDSSNFGADFHTTPNSIIKLQEDLPQPRVSIASTAQAGLAYTDVLRADPYAANLLVVCPFVSGGLGTDGTVSETIQGLGDYHRVLGGQSNSPINFEAGSGTQATVAIGTGVYYGSSLDVTTSSIRPRAIVGTALTITGDYTIEFWSYINSFAADGTHLVQYDTDAGATGWAITHDQGKGRFLLRDDASTSHQISTTVGVATTGQWTHWAGVYERNKNTITLYVNGVAVGINTNVRSDYPSAQFSGLNRLHIGSNNGDGSRPMLGYMQDLRIYNTAKYKGGFDVPKPYTPVGIGTWRAVPDTTANNFATLNAIDARSNSVTFADGNLSFTAGTVNQSRGASTIGITTGKYYFEARLNTAGGTYPTVGVCGIVTSIHDTFVGQDAGSFGYYSNGGVNGTGGNGGTYSTYTTGDIIGVAINLTDSQLTFYKNGSNAVTSGTTYEPLTSGNGYRAAVSSLNSGKWNLNFGQNPTFSGNVAAGTFTDSNGKGLFKYEPPSGFLALCEDNLPTPAIKNPGEYFKTVLYTGDGSNNKSITGIGFTPDVVWIKDRNSVNNHYLVDSVRGLAGGGILPSNTTKENGNQTLITNLASDGFTVGNTYNGSSNSATNGSGNSFVAWCWRAGAGTTSTNTDGSIQSVVSVNQDAGFSIVSYTGDGNSGATVGHGLGKTPSMIIIKNRDDAQSWYVGHKGTGLTGDALGSYSELYTLFLNSTAARANYGGAVAALGDSSVFAIGSGQEVNVNTQRFIAYCWAEIEGFSKFGSYVGNGSADGPFVYCGFKPAFLLYKRTDTNANWILHDSARSSYNVNSIRLFPNLSDIEATSSGTNDIDFLSNGFKCRSSHSETNASGGTYIFAAFAESPINYSNAK